MDGGCGGRDLEGRTETDELQDGLPAQSGGRALSKHTGTHALSLNNPGRPSKWDATFETFFAPLRKDPAIGAGTNRWDELAAGSLTVHAEEPSLTLTLDFRARYVHGGVVVCQFRHLSLALSQSFRLQIHISNGLQILDVFSFVHLFTCSVVTIVFEMISCNAIWKQNILNTVVMNSERPPRIMKRTPSPDFPQPVPDAKNNQMMQYSEQMMRNIKKRTPTPF